MLGTWPDERYEQAADPVALACLELLTEEDRWIHRRVETIDLLGRELVRRQVTVEFTLPDSLHDDLRVGDRGPWCVPLATVEKRPLRNFDLRENDDWLPILGREHNCLIAVGLVTAAARLATAPSPLEPEAQQLLELIIRSDLPQARGALRDLRVRAAGGSQLEAILDDATSGYFISTLAESYVLFALLADPRGRRILKYSYDEHLQQVRTPALRAERLAQRLGWSALVIDVAVPTAPHTASYHAEVVVPDGLRLVSFIVDSRTDDLLSTDIERGVDRASLHAPRVPLDARPVLVAAMSAERSGVPTLAFVISAVTSLLLLVGAAVGRLDSPAAGSSVAVLLSGSVLFAAAVTRSHEHRLVRGVFAGPRWLLSIVALAAVAAAASVAFGADPAVRDPIWYAAGGASAVACLVLAVALLRAQPLTRRHDPSDADDHVT